MTNAFALHIANIESLTRDVSNVIEMCSNGQHCQQGYVLRTAQQHSQVHGSKHSAAKQMVQRIVHIQPNAQTKQTQTQHTPITFDLFLARNCFNLWLLFCAPSDNR